MTTQHITCDIGKEKSGNVHYVQGEEGRTIEFSFINSLIDESEEININDYTLTIHILKSDGNFTIEELTKISSKKATYTLTANDCAVGGRGFYDVALTQNNKVIYTSHGDFVGDNRAVSDDAVESVSVAYGVTFPEGFQEKLIAGEHITINGNVISAEGESYTAGNNISISEENVISATDTTYTAGAGISISNENVISANKPTIEVIYTNPSTSAANITLADNTKFTEYDFLLFEAAENSSNYYTSTCLIYKQQFIELLNNNGIIDIDYLLADVNLYYRAISDNTINVYGARNMYIRKIYGIKF